MNTDSKKFKISNSQCEIEIPDQQSRRRTGWCKLVCSLSVFISVHLCFLSLASAQEIVANLAGGRVYVYVANGGIVVGALPRPVEAKSVAPVIVPLSGRRVAVLLGAVEWTIPGAAKPELLLAAEIPKLLSELAGPKRLAQEATSDLEELGTALLDPLRGVVSQIHRKLDVGPDEPVLELVLVGYTEGYGPEVWSLRYRVAQDHLRDGYWRTRILRPMYVQHYPPEKDQPRTIIEVRYPESDPAPTLRDLLARSDARLAALRAAEATYARVLTALENGESHKAPPNEAAQFLRAALTALAPAEVTPVLGVISEQRGLSWILAPPESPVQKAEEEKREPGAPTLRKKPN